MSASFNVRHFAAEDRTFKTVRLNQGTATETVPVLRGRRCELPGPARLPIPHGRPRSQPVSSERTQWSS
jgi:hypothetical protein